MTRSLSNLYIYCHEAVWCFFHKRHPKLLRWMVEVPKELCRRLLCRCIRCSRPHRKDSPRLWRGSFYWHQCLIEAKAKELGQEVPINMRALAADEKLAARYRRHKMIAACDKCDSDGFIWVPLFQPCPSCYRQEEDCYVAS